MATRKDRDERDAVVAQRVGEGASLRSIAEELSTGRTEIYRALSRLGISSAAVAEAKASAPKKVQKRASNDKEPDQWGQSEALRKNTYDQIWGLAWSPISAETFVEFVNELTRTPAEYSRNGGVHWSPTNAELAARLRVPVDLVDDWAQHGIDEPWEICVVRAYARTGIVVTTGEPRVPAIVVHRALARANSLEDAASATGIPLAMLEHHLEVGAPANTHGRAYLLMDSEEYRDAGMRNLLPIDSQRADETIARMLGDGATFDEIALEVGVTAGSVNTRIKKLGLSAARARKGGR